MSSWGLIKRDESANIAMRLNTNYLIDFFV